MSQKASLASDSLEMSRVIVRFLVVSAFHDIERPGPRFCMILPHPYFLIFLATTELLSWNSPGFSEALEGPYPCLGAPGIRNVDASNIGQGLWFGGYN